MGLLEGLAELIAPTRCAGCDLPGSLLCDACKARAFRFLAEQSCPVCAAPFGALTCTECWHSQHAFNAAVALGEMGDPLARAVVLHKDAGERRLGACLGVLLGDRVKDAWPGWAEAVVPVPPKPGALARRGFDHAEAIARPVARSLGVSVVPLLSWLRVGADQRELGRLARAANLADALGVVTGAEVPSRILVVDDVMTTGATMDAAAGALLEAGAVSVRVAVVARVW